MASLTLGAKLDENITLRAMCVDSAGNACSDVARWTVLYPNGTTYLDNKEGGNTTDDIRHLDLWLNYTGVWFVVVNWSTTNVTREYNVLVEDYTTTAQANVEEDVNLAGLLIFLGIIIIAIIFLAVRMDEKHTALKWFLVLVALTLIMYGFAYANLVVSGISTANLLSTGYKWSFVILGIVATYLLYYILISLKEIVVEWRIKKKNG